MAKDDDEEKLAHARRKERAREFLMIFMLLYSALMIYGMMSLLT